MKRLFIIILFVFNIEFSLGQSNTKGLQLLHLATQDYHNFIVNFTSASYSEIISKTEMAVKELESVSDTINLCRALVLLNDLYSEPLNMVFKTVENYNRIQDMIKDTNEDLLLSAKCGMIGIYLNTRPEYALKIVSSIDSKDISKIRTIDELIRNVYTMASAYIWAGDYVSASYVFSILDIFKPEELDDYSLVWYLIAKGDYALYQLSYFGKVNDAFLILIDCFDTLKKRNIVLSMASVMLQRDLGIAFQKLYEYKESLKCFEDMMNPPIISIEFGRNSFSNIISMEQIAKTYSGLRDYNIADSLLVEAIKIVDDNSLTNSLIGMSLYASYASNLSLQKEYELASEAYKKSREIGEIINHEEPQLYANLAINLHLANRLDEALDEVITGLDIERDNIHRTFLSLSEKGRESFWTMRGYQNIRLYTIAATGVDDKKGALFNIALLSKGILMESSSHFIEMIENSTDPELHREWENYLSLLNEMNKIQSSIGTEIDEKERLSLKLLEQESILMAKAAAFRDYVEGINYTWHDIANVLKEDEVAIEFIRYNEWETRKAIYYASVLQHDGPPVNIPLTELDEKEIQKWSFRKKYKTRSMYKVLIEPLSEHIKNKKKIYFSPVGCLNNISVENIPIPKGGYLSDIYEIHRLTSTRMIDRLNQIADLSCAFLFGGLNYNSTTEEMEYYASQKKTRSSDELHSWSYLPESLEEVQIIGNQLSQINPVIISGSEGVEERFKRLSGEGVNLIHIATHGYYDKEKALKVVQSNNPIEDEALKSFGLVFSGANNSNIEEAEVDNGLLSAEEISKLNLIGCELVVLSACGTGLGLTTSFDESYGLIRAFKKAGCKSILMSLWDVDDKVSQLFMEHFYQSLLAGFTKSESINEARKKVREVYLDPKYWAPFVLID